MGFLAGSKKYSIKLAYFSFFVLIIYTLLLFLFIIRKNIQPIKYRWPFLLICVSISVIIRILLILIWSLYPNFGFCHIQIFFHNGTYTGLALGTVRLYLLLFSYKLQNERINMLENGASRGPWMKHISWTYKSRIYPISFIFCITPPIFENMYINEISCDDVIKNKKNSIFIKDNNGSFIKFPDEDSNYCIFSDRCPGGSIDSNLYLYVLAFYFFIISILAMLLKSFDKDRFFINMEFRLTTIWMAMYIISDTIIQSVIPSLELYLYTPQEFNELLFLLIYSFISLGYPIRKSYILSKNNNNRVDNVNLSSKFGSNLSSLSSINDNFLDHLNNNDNNIINSFNIVDNIIDKNNNDDNNNNINNSNSFNFDNNIKNIDLSYKKNKNVNNNKKTQKNPLSLSSSSSSSSHVIINKKALRKLLNNPNGLLLFKKHLQLEFSVENILSWIEIQKILKNIDVCLKNKKIDENIIKQIIKFKNTFINEYSESQVNISSIQRDNFEIIFEKINIPSFIISKNYENFYEKIIQIKKLLKDIDKEILGLMAKDSFQRFINTDSYKKWCKENKNIKL